MSSKQEEWSDDLEDVVVQTEFNQACTRYGTRKEHVTELRAGALV